MIESIPNLPKGAIGFHMHGRIEKTDYTETLMPAIEAEVAAKRPLRILIRFGPDLDGFEPAALWEDMKAGVSSEIKNRSAWKRLALVTDIEWVRRAASTFGWLAPGELRVFGPAEEDEAATWVAAD